MARSGVGGALFCAAVLGVAGSAFAVETRETADYVALIIEAEEHVSRDARWVPIDAMTDLTAEQLPDPDGNHSAGASGGTYLELLPDYRTDHDSVIPPDAPEWIWGRAGTGPTASYAVDFPEPGRYHVHVRAFSTGTEDNGIHIGLDGQWPPSGARLQLCTALADDWRWSGRQRDSGGVACGIPGSIWLTVDEAGPATVEISAREDGFEIDRMMLIRDRTGNTRHCAPATDRADRIDCRDGGVELADEIVDLDVSIDGSIGSGLVGDRLDVVATIGNRDLLDVASGVELAFAADADDWRLIEADAGCERRGDEVICAIGRVHPGVAEEDEGVALALEALRDGLLRVEVSATARESDDVPDNDAATLQLEVDAPIRPTTLAVVLGGVPGVAVPGADTLLELSVDNTGEADALDARLVLSVPDGLDTGVLPDDCTVADDARTGETTRIDCRVGVLGAGLSRGFALSVSSATEGDYAIGAQASAANAPSGDAVASLDVSEPDAADGEDDEGVDVDPGLEVGPEMPVARPVAANSDGGAAGPLFGLLLVFAGALRWRGARGIVRHPFERPPADHVRADRLRPRS